MLQRVGASGAITGIGMFVFAWIPATAGTIGVGTWLFSPSPFVLLPRGVLKPTLQFVLNPIANLLKLIPQPGGLLAHLIAKAPGSAQEFLTHTGPSQW
jgi:hypothetical protein